MQHRHVPGSVCAAPGAGGVRPQKDAGCPSTGALLPSAPSGNLERFQSPLTGSQPHASCDGPAAQSVGDMMPPGQRHRGWAAGAARVMSSHVPLSAGLCAQMMPTSRGMSTGEPS